MVVKCYCNGWLLGVLFFLTNTMPGLFADIVDITIHNKTDLNLNMRFYYHHEAGSDVVAHAASGQVSLDENSKKKLSRPDKKLRKKFPWPFFYDRYLVVSLQQLPDALTSFEWTRLPKVAVGDVDTALSLFSFYVVESAGGVIKVLTSLMYQTHPARKFASFLKNTAFDRIRTFVAKSSYAKASASVLVGDGLCEKERTFIEKRLTVVRPTLEKLLGPESGGLQVNDDIPRIAFCFSGGGFRAMIATLGWLMGAQDAGLLDCALYISALSGSTWFLFPWVYLGTPPLEQFRERIIKITDVSFPFPISQQDIENIVKFALLPKLFCEQYVSSVDFYGAMLANKLFFDLPSAKRQSILISDFESRVDGGRCPLPIGTAVEASSWSDYKWLEVTPYAIGGSFLNGYVPSWAFGGIFKHGKLRAGTTIGGLPIGYLLGIFGSAYCASLREIIEEKQNEISSPFIRSILHESLQDAPPGKFRAWPAIVRNPTYKMSNMPLSARKNLKLVDAGLGFNLPVPPLVRTERKVDLIIIGDASAGLDKGAGELDKVVEYMKKYHIPFPAVDMKDAHKKPFSIFRSNDSSVPVIIYMPLVSNPEYSSFDVFDAVNHGYAGTFNFKYTAEQVQELSGLTQYNMHSSIEQIRQVIRDVIEAKRAARARTHIVNTVAA